MHVHRRFALTLVAALSLTVCAFAWQNAAPASPKQPRGTVIVNITASPDEVFRLLTAFHVAEDAIAANYKVILFFNERGVTVPLKRLSDELQLGTERSLWRVLNDLIANGAEVVVARESVRTLNLADSEFIVETQFGQWGGSIFCKFSGETVVFNY